MTVKQVGQVSISPGNYMYDWYMSRPGRYFAPRLEFMPSDLTPSARAVILALWFCELSGEYATKAKVFELTGASESSVKRAWTSLRSQGLLQRV